MNTGDEGHSYCSAQHAQYTIHASEPEPCQSGWVMMVGLALIISMSALVSFSELLLALVGSSELYPLYPESRAGGW